MARSEAVAVLGTGRMGRAMVGTLRRAGFEVVIYNRTRATAEEFATSTGARVVGTPREAAAQAPVVMSSLADDAAVEAVYGGPDGAVAGLQPESVVLETSTIDPATLARLGAAVVDKDAMLLDTPVSGSVALVDKGELTIMVGGDGAALARARPVLDALAAKVFHLGDLGAGATMKLAVNALVHALNLAVSESLVLAERAGIDRAAAYDVFAAGAGGAPFVHYKRASFEKPDTTPVGFSIDLAAKDMDLILTLADRVGASMQQAATVQAVLRSAIDQGLGARDMTAVAGFLRNHDAPLASAPRGEGT